ncbi:MAG: DUF2029 domain-containing protein [Thermoleophilia bacterium]|nr:DUF2029 domain-containing protein [Thermoleophilia bacterium]
MPRLVQHIRQLEPQRLDRLVWPVWLVTRLLVLGLVLGISRGRASEMQDIAYYLEVARHVVDTGSLPTDAMWQYPPGAALVLVIPLAAGSAAYGITFVLLMFACDAGITRLLTGAARDHGSRIGVWAWLLAMPWLREYPPLRFDLLPTLLAVAALLWLGRRPLLAGALAGIGVLVKAWPLVVLAAEWHPRRLVRASVALVATLAVGLVAASALHGPIDSALQNRDGRGLQVEAIAATPWHASAIAHGTTAEARWGNGSWDLVDERANDVATALDALTGAAALLVGLTWIITLRRARASGTWPSRAAGFDLAFVALLTAIATSKVLSPQFLIWLLALAAVCLSCRDTRMRTAALLVVASTIPTFFVLDSPIAIVIRNLLLVAALLAAWRGALDSARRGGQASTTTSSERSSTSSTRSPSASTSAATS